MPHTHTTRATTLGARALPWALTAACAAVAARAEARRRRASRPELDAYVAAHSSALAFGIADERAVIARAEHPPNRRTPWYWWAGYVCDATRTASIRDAHTWDGWAPSARLAHAAVREYLTAPPLPHADDDLADEAA